MMSALGKTLLVDLSGKNITESGCLHFVEKAGPGVIFSTVCGKLLDDTIVGSLVDPHEEGIGSLWNACQRCLDGRRA